MNFSSLPGCLFRHLVCYGRQLPEDEDVVLKLGACTSLGSTLYCNDFYTISYPKVSVQVSLQLHDNTTLNFSSYFQQFHLSSPFIISLFHTVAEAI